MAGCDFSPHAYSYDDFLGDVRGVVDSENSVYTLVILKKISQNFQKFKKNLKIFKNYRNLIALKP
jgi:hypothetical protein